MMDHGNMIQFQKKIKELSIVRKDRMIDRYGGNRKVLILAKIVCRII